MFFIFKDRAAKYQEGMDTRPRTALDPCLYPLTSSLGLYLCCDSPAERGGDWLLITVAHAEEKPKGHVAARLAKGRGGQGKGMWWRAGDFVLSWEGVSH